MGKVIMSGIVPKLKAPITGIVASDISVGSSVYLLENGTPVEYLVVNQGVPGNSSNYDSSCDGTWLLRKDCYAKQAYSSSSTDVYANSSMTTYLNNTFLAVFDENTLNAIKQVSIPASTSKNISVKAFLLSAPEVGWSNYSGAGVTGTVLDYFSDVTSDDFAKCIAYYNGTTTMWWTRSYDASSTTSVYIIQVNGGPIAWTAPNVDNSGGLPCCARPALILPFNAVFDEDTLVFKEVA